MEMNWSRVCSNSRMVGMMVVLASCDSDHLIHNTVLFKLFQPSLRSLALVISSEEARRGKSSSSDQKGSTEGVLLLMVVLRGC